MIDGLYAHSVKEVLYRICSIFNSSWIPFKDFKRFYFRVLMPSHFFSLEQFLLSSISLFDRNWRLYQLSWTYVVDISSWTNCTPMFYVNCHDSLMEMFPHKLTLWLQVTKCPLCLVKELSNWTDTGQVGQLGWYYTLSLVTLWNLIYTCNSFTAYLWYETVKSNTNIL